MSTILGDRVSIRVSVVLGCGVIVRVRVMGLELGVGWTSSVGILFFQQLQSVLSCCLDLALVV